MITMRITVDIDDTTLSSVRKATGLTKKSPAIRQALKDYLRERKKRVLLQKIVNGETDYAATNEELEARSLYDPD
jgi:Arc/MetJ family transcription regulator